MITSINPIPKYAIPPQELNLINQMIPLELMQIALFHFPLDQLERCRLVCRYWDKKVITLEFMRIKAKQDSAQFVKIIMENNSKLDDQVKQDLTLNFEKEIEQTINLANRHYFFKKIVFRILNELISFNVVNLPEISELLGHSPMKVYLPLLDIAKKLDFKASLTSKFHCTHAYFNLCKTLLNLSEVSTDFKQRIKTMEDLLVYLNVIQQKKDIFSAEYKEYESWPEHFSEKIYLLLSNYQHINEFLPLYMKLTDLMQRLDAEDTNSTRYIATSKAISDRLLEKLTKEDPTKILLDEFPTPFGVCEKLVLIALLKFLLKQKLYDQLIDVLYPFFPKTFLNFLSILCKKEALELYDESLATELMQLLMAKKLYIPSFELAHRLAHASSLASLEATKLLNKIYKSSSVDFTEKLDQMSHEKLFGTTLIRTLVGLDLHQQAAELAHTLVKPRSSNEKIILQAIVKIFREVCKELHDSNFQQLMDVKIYVNINPHLYKRWKKIYKERELRIEKGISIRTALLLRANRQAEDSCSIA